MTVQVNTLVVLSKLACNTPVPVLVLGGTSLAADKLAVRAVLLEFATGGGTAIGAEPQAVKNKALAIEPRAIRLRMWVMVCFLLVKKMIKNVNISSLKHVDS